MPTARRAGGRPYVLSEFGGYSWNIEGHVWNYKKSFGYIQYKNSANLSQAYRKLYFNQIIPLVEKGLSATIAHTAAKTSVFWAIVLNSR
jgi:hypothetical protein